MDHHSTMTKNHHAGALDSHRRNPLSPSVAAHKRKRWPAMKSIVACALPFLLALAGASVTSYANFMSCDTLVIPLESQSSSTSDLFHPRPRSYGLWQYRWQEFTVLHDGSFGIREGCLPYDTLKQEHSSDFDHRWNMARWTSCLTVTLAALAIVGGCVQAVLQATMEPVIVLGKVTCPNTLNWAAFSGLLASAAASQCFTTLVFLSSNGCHENPLQHTFVSDVSLYSMDCEMSVGGWNQIYGSLLLFAASLATMAVPWIQKQEFTVCKKIACEEEDEEEDLAGWGAMPILDEKPRVHPLYSKSSSNFSQRPSLISVSESSESTSSSWSDEDPLEGSWLPAPARFGASGSLRSTSDGVVPNRRQSVGLPAPATMSRRSSYETAASSTVTGTNPSIKRRHRV